MTLKELEDKIGELEALAEITTEQEAQLKQLKGSLAQVEQIHNETTRQLEIHKISDLYNISAEAKDKYLKDTSITPQKVKDDLLASLSNNHPFRVEVKQPNRDKVRASMGDVIAERMGMSIVDKSDLTKDYANASLHDITGILLQAEGKTAPRDPLKRVQAAMTTSSIPELFIKSGKRTLMKEIEAYPTSYKDISTVLKTPDFKKGEMIKAGGFGLLDEHQEGGDVKSLEFGGGAEEYQAITFAGQTSITDRMFRNNDLGAMLTPMRRAFTSAERTKDALMYDLLTSSKRAKDLTGYKMKDGLPIFHANHGNLTNTPLTSSSLSAARVKMSNQKQLDGTPMYLVPDTIVVGEALRDTAIRILYSSADIEGDNPAIVNVHKGTLNIVVSPLIEDDSWYLLCHKTGDGLKEIQLDGTSGKPIVTKTNMSALSIDYEIVQYTGAAISGYQSVFKGK